MWAGVSAEATEAAEPSFPPNLSEFEVKGSIASWCGGAGLILVATHPKHDTKFALRRLHFEKRTPAVAALVQQEILTTRQLQHPNILPYYTSFVDGLYLYIVTPLMDLGSCRDLINKKFHSGLPEYASCIILKEVLQGLDYIHKKGFIHRGIRSSHVLVSTSGRVRLTGLRNAASLMLRGKRQKRLHTLPPTDCDNKSLLFLSPELLEQNLRGYDEKSDIYSIGMLACELGNGIIPFYGIPTTLMLTEKVRGNVPQLLDSSTIHNFINNANNCDEVEMDELEHDENASTDYNVLARVYSKRKLNNAFHQFTNLCFLREPTSRPSCSQLLTHQFFKQLGKWEVNIAQILDVCPINDGTLQRLLEEEMSEMQIEDVCEWDF